MKEYTYLPNNTPEPKTFIVYFNVNFVNWESSEYKISGFNSQFRLQLSS